ncbi:MAG TPA: sulfur carrier protein ThiS [Bacillota bacterium]|nr:sulfur carrier protein ThiS [Bacillota bacterium]
MKVNGSIISLNESQSLYDFLVTQSFDITRVAVERNGEIVPRSAYRDVLLHDEDKLEVVTFVGGG